MMECISNRNYCHFSDFENSRNDGDESFKKNCSCLYGMHSCCISHRSIKGQRASYDAASSPPTYLPSRLAWLEIFGLLVACVYNEHIIVEKKRDWQKAKKPKSWKLNSARSVWGDYFGENSGKICIKCIRNTEGKSLSESAHLSTLWGWVLDHFEKESFAGVCMNMKG